MLAATNQWEVPAAAPSNLEVDSESKKIYTFFLQLLSKTVDLLSPWRSEKGPVDLSFDIFRDKCTSQSEICRVVSQACVNVRAARCSHWETWQPSGDGS